MGYWGWKPYVSVAERRDKAEKAAAKAKKSGATLSPIAPYRGAIAKTFWGKAWCDNLERYSDYANRLPRGRTYVRNGSVIDLHISEGAVRAQVMGSSLYKVSVSVVACPEKQWRTIGADCSGSIDSMVELLQGKFSRGVMERLCKTGTGLFPLPKEIKFTCSCPDGASMCKHVAAVLYGVGARLDQQPELLFALRHVDANDLVRQAGAGFAKPAKRPTASKVLDDAQLADVFGIEMAAVSLPPAKPATARNKSPAGKTTTKKAAKQVISAARKSAATSAPKKLAVKPSAAPRKSLSGKRATSKANAMTSSATPKATVTKKRTSARLAKDKSR
ncbi:SWIM zinc finger family protein [Dyella sp.]|uniref:SWIM zinc finger family protein n=1 Tax=Dyella sp. TaxID=1869338 RepID=UPI002B462D4B|nr:SWIM zinc finger family protein [Dyella sp.]HKT30611.1 SWIM zinc finger family protein [Dyella sp.]